MADIIKAASQKLKNDPPEPEVELGVRQTFVSIASSLGNQEECRAHGARALQLAERLYGPDALEVADVIEVIVESMGRGGSDEALVQLGRRGVAIRERILGNEHVDTQRLRAFSEQIGFVASQLRLRDLLFPNPANNFVTVVLTELYSLTYFELYDLNGKLILKEILSNNQTTISTKEIASGAYLFKVTNTNGTIKQGKLVKE